VRWFGRDEPNRVVIHLCTKAILGICLYSSPDLKLAKMLCLSYYCLCLLFNKIEEEGRTGSGWKPEVGGERGGEEQGGGMAKTMNARMTK
jgi:hypothetical protein